MSVLIISRDKDFAEPLMEQVKRQLNLDCAIAESAAGAGKCAFIVTTKTIKNQDCPVIKVEQGSVRLLALLNDIEAAVTRSGPEILSMAGGYGLQLRAKQLIHTPSGKKADLTDKEAQLLQALAEAEGKVVAKEQLLKTIWGIEAALDTHTLETHIYRLRTKFRELADDDMITAADGGYALGAK